MIDKRTFIFSLFIFISGLSIGQTVYTLYPSKEPQSVNRAFLYFIDESNSLTIENILQKGNFKPSEAEVPNLNVFYGTSWSYSKFTCKEKANYYLSLEPCTNGEVHFFQKRNKDAWTHEAQGSLVSDLNPRIVTNHLLFKLNLNAGDTISVLMKINSDQPLQIILKAGTLESFVQGFHLNDFFYCFVFGIVSIMLLYNLYLFFSQKQYVYLSYSVYAFSSILFLVQTSGNSLHFPYLLFKLVDVCPTVPPALLAIAALIFTLQLFKNNLPSILTKLIWSTIGIASLTILLPIFGFQREAFLLLQPVALFYIILAFSTGIIALKRKLSSALYYLMGFGTYSVFFFVFILCVVGVLPFSENSFKIVSTGLTIEVIMLSFALGDKMKSFLLDKQKAQEEALIQLKENERIVREQNIILEQKVNERTAQLSIANQELSEQKHEIEQQKEVVEEQQKELKDSIHYARRIQQALLASDSLMNTYLKNYFVFFQPKDIVSGDFYWATALPPAKGKGGGRFLMAIADSTGHGVPGAFMSLLNISFLNEAVNEKQIHQPAEILNHVRKRLIDALKDDGSEEGGKDGMDCILMLFDLSELSLGNGAGLRLEFACANNSLLLVRNGEPQFFSADKMAVGRSPRQDVPFTNQSIELQKGDTIYAYTDGYADQFGGIKGKKFKYKQLEELILNSNALPCAERKKLLHSTIESWRGNLEQVDDILVAGITID